MSANILILSAHESLECQLLNILHGLGHNPFSVGHYTNRNFPIHPTHSVAHLPFDEEKFNIFCKYHDYKAWADRLGKLAPGHLPPYNIKLKKEFIDLFDIILILYYEENLTLNWEYFKNKPVIVYQISQRNYHRSDKLFKSNVTRVHMSPKEHVLHGYKPDAVIRHAVNCDYYKDYVGGTDTVLTINKWLKARGQVAAYDWYDEATRGFNRVVAGFGNKDLDYAKSDVSEEELMRLRQTCGAYISLCSWHGNVTYSFCEALAVGTPTVTCGPKFGNDLRNGWDTYEAHEFIKPGVNGFWSDDPREAAQQIKFLLDNPEKARLMGENARRTAIQNFSIERASEDWKQLLSKVI